MTSLHFDETPTAIADFWARGSALPILAIVYLLSTMSAEDALKFCAVFNPIATLIWPWNGEFISKLACKPLHKVPTIMFPLLSVAGLLAL